MTQVTLEQIKKMPKVELHRHVDGAVDPRLLYGLAGGHFSSQYKSSQNVADAVRILPGMPVEEVMAKFGSVIRWMQTKENIETVFAHQIKDLAQENIVYAELRFAPAYHMRNGLSLEEVILAALNGIGYGLDEENERWEKYPHMDTRLILCINRECSSDLSKRIAQEAVRFSKFSKVVGIDLACNEALYPPELHKEAFAETFGTRVRRTVHAGEFGNDRMKNIGTALIVLRADRISHAIGLTRNPYLMAICREHRVGIESCPVSNVICGNVSSIKALSLDALAEEGVFFNVNSDDPALFQTSLSETLFQTAKAYDWSLEDLKRMMRDAMEMAFVSHGEKLEILNKYF